MEFIVASISIVLTTAWMLVLMFAAFELAVYLIGFAVELCVMCSAFGAKSLVSKPVQCIKQCHDVARGRVLSMSFAAV